MNKSKRSGRKPLNVAKDKIQETRDRICGYARDEIAQEASQSLTVTSEDETCEDALKILWKCLDTNTSSSEITNVDEVLYSEDTKQVLQCLRKPLVLGIREITLRRPRDPIDYLACWLLNYRSCNVKTKLPSRYDEKLTLLRSQLQNLHTSEGKLLTVTKDIKEGHDDEEGQGNTEDGNSRRDWN